MHRLTSLRRLAVGAALAGAAIGAAPSLASAASPCSYDPITRIATITDATDSFHQLRIGTSGGLLTVDSTGHCISSTSDVATVTNTDTIFVTARASGASDGVVLDQSQGAFAPGATTENDQVPEIEIGIVGQSGHLTIIGTSGFDALRVGGNHNANLNTDDDDDVTFNASDVSLLGGNGGDFLTGLGYGSRPATTLPLGESGGAGDDLMRGGLGADHLAGNAGNDTLVTVDGVQDFVNGGPDFDIATSDGGDVLSSIESPAVGRLKLAPRAVRADARKWAKMTLRWTHPKSWRELRKVEVELYRGDRQVGTIDVRPRGARLSAHGAVQIMSNRSLLTHSAKTVTARLGMKFPRSLAGTSLRVAVQATDRHGHTQLDPDAGNIRIAK